MASQKVRTKDKELFLSLKGIGILKDTTIVVVLITGLSYFIAYAFRWGYTSYYHIGEFARSNVETSDISMAISVAISEIAPYIASSLLIYIIFTFILVFFTDFLIFLVNPLAITITIVPIINKIQHRDLSENLIEWIVIVSCLVILIKVIASKEFQSLPLLPNISNQVVKKIKILLSVWEALQHLKWLVICLILLMLFQTFYHLGNKAAQEKNSFLIIEQGDSNYVMVEERGDKIIIAPVDLNKHIIESKYSIIEMKSNIKNPLVLKRVIVKDGLKVK